MVVYLANLTKTQLALNEKLSTVMWLVGRTVETMKKIKNDKKHSNIAPVNMDKWNDSLM